MLRKALIVGVSLKLGFSALMNTQNEGAGGSIYRIGELLASRRMDVESERDHMKESLCEDDVGVYQGTNRESGRQVMQPSEDSFEEADEPLKLSGNRPTNNQISVSRSTNNLPSHIWATNRSPSPANRSKNQGSKRSQSVDQWDSQEHSQASQQNYYRGHQNFQATQYGDPQITQYRYQAAQSGSSNGDLSSNPNDFRTDQYQNRFRGSNNEVMNGHENTLDGNSNFIKDGNTNFLQGNRNHIESGNNNNIHGSGNFISGTGNIIGGLN